MEKLKSILVSGASDTVFWGILVFFSLIFMIGAWWSGDTVAYNYNSIIGIIAIGFYGVFKKLNQKS